MFHFIGVVVLLCLLGKICNNGAAWLDRNFKGWDD